MRGQRHVPAVHYHWETLGTHCTGGCLGPRAGLDMCSKSRLHQDSTLGPSSPWPVAIPTTLPDLNTIERSYYCRWPKCDCQQYKIVQCCQGNVALGSSCKILLLLSTPQTYLGRPANILYFSSILSKFEVSLQFSIKVLSTKFHDNLSSGSRSDACVQTNRQKQRQTDGWTEMRKLIVAVGIFTRTGLKTVRIL